VARDIVINLLAYADAVARGTKQEQLFAEVASLGVPKVEVRREWIKDYDVELEQMRKRAEELSIEVYYSIPDVLFKQDKLNRFNLSRYFQEAEMLGATRIKFAVGDFNCREGQELVALKSLISAHDILVTVEGDQSAANGRVEPILALMEACSAQGIAIYNTFDVGNFVWVGQEPLYNAVKLAQYVQYIHLKDVEMTQQGPQVRCLDEGNIDWRAALRLLPKNVPIGIEFPCGEQPREIIANAIRKIREAN